MTGICLHATCIAFDDGAVLLRGPSGAGKSDLAYRLIGQENALLVADDQVQLTLKGNAVVAQARSGWSGLLELRGLGIVSVPAIDTASLVLLVDLVGRDEVPRLSEPHYEELMGKRLPVIRFHAFDATSPAKIKLAVTHLPLREGPNGPKGGFPGDDGRLR